MGWLLIAQPLYYWFLVFFHHLAQLLLRHFSFRPRRSRSTATYSRQTFPWTMCRSVCRSVQCIVEKRRIRSGSRLAS